MNRSVPVTKCRAPGELTHSPRCRSVRRNPVTITTTGTWDIVMPLAYDVASVRHPAATTAATATTTAADRDTNPRALLRRAVIP